MAPPPPPLTTVITEADQAREDVAARLEGLARQIRRTTTQDIEALDAAYGAVVTLAHVLQTALDASTPCPPAQRRLPGP